ncbi:MAG: superoxide dismutase family protein [Candidatus Omnitrophota bacterium]
MKKNFVRLMLVMIVSWTVYAQAEMMHDHEEMPAPVMARAMITGTAEGSELFGEAVFIQKADGVMVEANVSGVDVPGKHGFHVHQFGSCADKGNGAGGHFNPHGVQHGFKPDDGENAHLGDMGNIEIAETGEGTLSLFLPHVTLSGENGIAGRAVILHEKEDDFGQPTGNAGARIGCGVIGYIATE